MCYEVRRIFREMSKDLNESNVILSLNLNEVEYQTEPEVMTVCHMVFIEYGSLTNVPTFAIRAVTVKKNAKITGRVENMLR